MPVTPPEAPTPPPGRSNLVAVFLVSFAVLSLEVALTRVFSAALKYHFSFLVVSVAVCGLGLGGMLAFFFPRAGHRAMSWLALAMGLTIAASLVVFFRVLLPSGADSLPAIASIVLAPFACAGAFLGLAFRMSPHYSGIVYGWDLLGSALAIPAVVLGMTLFNPVNAAILAGLGAVLAAAMLARGRLLPLVAGAPILALVAVNMSSNWLDIPAIDPSQDDHHFRTLHVLRARVPDARVVHSTWGPYARTDVLADGDPPTRMDIFTDGTVPAIQPRWDPVRQTHKIPDGILIDLPFEWVQGDRVLAIGPGGGLDLVLARWAGASVIHGVEVNPAMPGIVEKYQDFNGNPYAMPGVTVEIGDGRTFVARSQETYDLISLALTKAGTATMGASMVEGYLYTVEAARDYLRNLEEDGTLAFLTDQTLLGWRFLHAVLQHLHQDLGIPLNECPDHFAVVGTQRKAGAINPYSFLLLVGKRPIPKERIQTLAQLGQAANYKPLFIPGMVEGNPYALLRTSPDLESYYERIEQAIAKEDWESERPPNLRPVTDDSPYFSDLLREPPEGVRALSLFTVAGVAVLSLLAFLVRRGHGTREGSTPRMLPILGYFCLLGVGFMLVEIALIQKLILVLGHPTRSLTVCLFAILLGGAAGSRLSQRWPAERTAPRCCAVVVVGVLLLLLAIHWLVPVLLPLPATTRLLLSFLLCASLGVAMGAPFPLGLRQVGRMDPALVPWIWGLNGLCSVLGAMLTVLGARSSGFTAVLALGAALYLLAALLPPWFAKSSSATSS